MKTEEKPSQGEQDEPAVPVRRGVNEFALKFATVNGTGSASANNLILRSIFRMGVPVSGKNLFPSNIQGLPTWYEIRVSGVGNTSRSAAFDLTVAMNGQTYAADVAEVSPGGYLLYDSSWPLPKLLLRPEINFLGIPLAKLIGEIFPEPRQRILMKNIAYAGAVAALIGIDRDVVLGLLSERFGARKAIMTANRDAFLLGFDYAESHFSCPLPFHLERMGANDGKILIDGNSATALGCLYAGATVAAWYPITPATSVAERFRSLCERYRREEVATAGGEREIRNDYLILQAEDELAAVGMVIGASWAGARSFTSTSGPGISLMNEQIGLAYYTEIPAVIIDVQRAGPSTGMPTRVQQADILACAYASHGDTKHLLLFPADPKECFEMAVLSFDLAERFQTPVMLLSDLDIGMNDWVIPRLEWDDSYRPDRGRVLGPEELERIEQFFRYDDADAEFVTPRTLPGVSERGAYFIRGSGHDRFGHYTEDGADYQQVVDRLAAKHRAAAAHMPEPVIERRPGSRFGVITIGSCEPAVKEAIGYFAGRDIPLDYLRVRGFPFTGEIASFIAGLDRCFVVEQNRDAQLRSLLILEAGAAAGSLVPILSYGGLPLTATQVIEGIEAAWREES